MAKSKKHIYCQKCGNICNWYKKGKNHRVLVCPKCGILAHNPIPWATIGKIGGSLIPIPGASIVGEMLGSAVEGASSNEKPAKTTISTREKGTRDLNKLSRNDLIINQELGV